MRLNRRRMSDDEIERAYKVRVAVFLISAVLVTLCGSVIFQAIQTLNRLDVVESERDKWQRASNVIQQLNLKNGNVAVDLGSGAGYFTLKLARAVGQQGRILAVDIRRVPLLFLQTRALLLGHHDISVIHADPDNPHLPTQAVDAVLVANTYHELIHPRLILAALSRSLTSGGRLVIVDSGPHSAAVESREAEMHRHELPSAVVESELRQNGFDVISRQDDFVTPPDDRTWWLIVARKR